MKSIAVILMLLGVLLTLGAGLMGIFLLAMSFDAPGSANDPKAWAMRLLLFVPAVLLAALVFWALGAYHSGNHVRSASMGSIFAMAAFGAFIYLKWSDASDLRKSREDDARRATEASLYPEQHYVRPVKGGADSLIVFPTRMVAYRIFDGTNVPVGGLLGHLNASRTALELAADENPRIHPDELAHFKDGQGRSFADCYPVVK